MDNMAADGELNSRVFPLADTSRRDYPIEEPVDCTWEMVVEKGQRVYIFVVCMHTGNMSCKKTVKGIFSIM